MQTCPLTRGYVSMKIHLYYYEGLLLEEGETGSPAVLGDAFREIGQCISTAHYHNIWPTSALKIIIKSNQVSAKYLPNHCFLIGMVMAYQVLAGLYSLRGEDVCTQSFPRLLSYTNDLKCAFYFYHE